MDDHLRLKAIQKAQLIVQNRKEEWGLQSELTSASLLTYENAMRRYWAIREEAKQKGMQAFLPLNKNSRNVLAAAIQRSILERVERATGINDQQELSEIFKSITEDFEVLARLKSCSGTDSDDNEPPIDFMKQRLVLLERFRPNWREDLLEYMADSKYAKFVLIQTITGCRSEELVRGVEIGLGVFGEYLIRLDTAKQRAGSQGNTIRVVRSSDPRLAGLLGRHCLTEGLYRGLIGIHRARAEYKVKNNYRQTISNSARRLFGIAVTPKMFRCCAAADLRAHGARTSEVAEFLGHSSTACANGYSRELNVRSPARVQRREKVASLKSPRLKVESKPLSESLINRLAASTSPGPSM